MAKQPPKLIPKAKQPPKPSDPGTSSSTSTTQPSAAPHQSVPNVTTQNKYDGLPADAEESEVMFEKIPKPEKNQPIIVTSSNVSVLNFICNEVITSKKFSLKMMQIGIKLEITDKNEFITMTNRLQKDGIEFYTYHTAATKPKKIILHGLCEIEDKELLEILAEQGITPKDVRKLTIREKRYDNQAVYILYFEPRSIKLGDLQKIRYLNNLCVTWEHFQSRKHDILPQCRNCQTFGHSSINCNRKPKCLTCAQSHKTADCSFRIPREELKKIAPTDINKEHIKCANCNASHTASYKGCPARREYKNLQSSYAERRRPANTRPQPFRYDERSFPSIVSKAQHNNSSQFTQHKPATMSYSEVTNSPSVSNDLFTSEELGIIWKELILSLQGCRNKMEQVMALGNVITKYIYVLLP